MKRFCKLALLIGFVNVVSLEGHSSSSSAVDSEVISAAGPLQIGSWMKHYFQYDKSDSPLKRQNNDSSHLVDAVAGYMKTADGETLHSLFYKPDVNAWSALYQQVAKKKFSTLHLIHLLDTTKTDIFNAYQGIEGAVETEAYFYIPTLIDNAMQQIFASWGFDESTPTDVIDQLKEIYGRIISGVLTPAENYDLLADLTKFLEGKKNAASLIEKVRLTALQECVGAVWYSDILLREGGKDLTLDRFLGIFLQDTGVKLSKMSFEKTQKHVSYQNPLHSVNYYHPNFQAIGLDILNRRVKDVEHIDWKESAEVMYGFKYRPSIHGHSLDIMIQPQDESYISNIMIHLPTDNRVEMKDKIDLFYKALCSPQVSTLVIMASSRGSAAFIKGVLG